MKLIECDLCDKEHLAPPPPPLWYSSFSVPLTKTNSKELKQWIKDNVKWRQMTGCRKQWWGSSIQH